MTLPDSSTNDCYRRASPEHDGLAFGLKFVLVETSRPGNIGAAARAMKTMGFSQLILVRPRFADALPIVGRDWPVVKLETVVMCRLRAAPARHSLWQTRLVGIGRAFKIAAGQFVVAPRLVMSCTS